MRTSPKQSVMSQRDGEITCLFCGEEFTEQGDLYNHFASRHLPDRSGSERFPTDSSHGLLTRR